MENKYKFGEKPKGVPDPAILCAQKRKGLAGLWLLRFVKTHDNFLIQVRTLTLAKSYI